MFNKITAFKVDENLTVEYPIHEITLDGVIPILFVTTSTSENKKYLNALLKQPKEFTRQLKQNRITSEILDRNRKNDRILYADFVVKDWKHIVDDKGDEVSFSNKNCREFFKALPSWIFDELRTFCGESSNFAGNPDLENTSKNL